MPTWTTPATWYHEKHDDHEELYALAAKWIKRFKVSSMLEIGGGLGFLSEEVDSYTCIELNPTIAEKTRELRPDVRVIVGDWLELDVSKWEKAFDCITALAVVEHCAHYEEFILKCLSLKPGLILISFYKGLSKGKDKIRRVRSGAVDGKVHDNLYGEYALRLFLEQQKKVIRIYQLFTVTRKCGKTETLLAIRPRSDQTVADKAKEKAKLVGNFIKVVTDTVVKHKGKLVSRAVIDERLAICQECPFFRPVKNRCAVCGCGVRIDKGFRLNLANKLAHPSSVCPKRKWKAVP
jgi:hypothetical protein